METEKTMVIFRKFKEGDVIALFPELLANARGSCDSFMHVGQHGAADYDGLIAMTMPATPEEYASLRKELENEPYKYVLDIRKRATRLSRDKRLAEARR